MSDYLVMTDEEYLMHFGTPHEGSTPHSGRFPYGSGKNPYQHVGGLRGYVKELREKGMTDTEIAHYFGWSTEQLKIRIGVEKEIEMRSQIAKARELMDKYNNKSKVAREMGISEGKVRSLLKAQTDEKNKIVFATAEMLKNEVNKYGPTDIGKGMQNRLNITDHTLNKAVAYLEQTEGFESANFHVRQVSTGKNTTRTLLYSKEQGWAAAKDAVNNGTYHIINDPYSEDGGRTWEHLEPPVSVSSKRVFIRYAEDGGADHDGLIEIRPGVEDLDMGRNQYAQVRIGVDGTHFMKGMAIYNPDLPEGVDIIYNTNKKKGAPFEKVFKPMKPNAENPFGAAIKANELDEDHNVVREVGQRHYIGKDGKRHLSAINIVTESGDWEKWSRRLSSQFLSKQNPELANRQLQLDIDRRKRDFDEIMHLTNPAVQRILLEKYASDSESAARHLKAAPLPGTQSHVLIPIPSMKDNEVYAPNFKNGEIVTLIRHPHADTSELPTLVVNNRNKEARKLLGNAPDAIGINKHNADILSGADFDGDTVLVIPNPGGELIEHRPQLEALKDFDTKLCYGHDAFPPGQNEWKKVGLKSKKEYDKDGNLIEHDGFNTQKEMGIISNLITDMQVKGCHDDELARAMKYSMVVIDAEKHDLNWKQAYNDFRIKELHIAYQGKAKGGASTLISRAKSPYSVAERKQIYDTMIDPETGKIDWDKQDETGKYVNRTNRKKKIKDPVTGKWVETDVLATQDITKMDAVDDAMELSSGTKMEKVYGTYANQCKDLTNLARKTYITLRAPKKNANAEAIYKTEVESLMEKLNESYKNRPLEAKANALANAKLKLWKEDNPDATGDEIKKHRGLFLKEARDRMSSGKVKIKITPKEWEAINAHALAGNIVMEILNNCDLDVVRQYATPKDYTPKLSRREINYVKMLSDSGRYTQAEIAQLLHVSVSTINKVLSSS